MAYQLHVNGERVRVEVEGEMPLLWVLRDLLGLRGAKYACGQGSCGACTVRVDGSALRSCVTSVADVDGSDVVTAEGLEGEVESAVLRAWEAEDVPQCGYCQTGMIMGVVDLLRRNPPPDDATIDRALAPYLCRCGTYVRIRRAVHRAASLLGATPR